MPLRFRSFVPYTLPGVLALIGWWWYISRKKSRITSHDSKEEPVAGLLASTVKGSNGMVETTHSRPCLDKPNAKEPVSPEQEVVAQIHTMATSTSVEELASSLVIVEKLATPPPCSIAVSEFQQSNLEVVGEKSLILASAALSLVEESSPHERLEAVVLSSETSQLPMEAEMDIGLLVKSWDQTLDKQDTKEMAPLVCQAMELSKAERPEPEGEVADDVLAVPFAENIQADLVKDGLSTNDDLAAVSQITEDQYTSAASQSLALDSPILSASFPISSSSPVLHDFIQVQNHTNGDLSRPVESSDSTEELQRLAAGLITEVISAATQEVMAVSSSRSQFSEGPDAVSSITSTLNGKEVDREEDECVSEVGSSEVYENHVEQHAEKIAKEVINGCLTPSVWEKSETQDSFALSDHQGPLESTQVLPKVQAKEEAVMGTEDSGCSTCQSEDGISNEDLVISTDLSAVHDSKVDLIQISGISASEGNRHQESSDSAVLKETVLSEEHATAACVLAHVNGEALRNGTSEAETDQSGGSDVNSMDSVDSCSALGTGNGQQSGSQASQSQSSDLIVWEIEVPKHLVGRLIGKQGRYVSFLKQSSGAKIYISTLPYTQEFQICHIEGAQQQVDKALAMIGKKFKDLDLTNLYAPPSLPLSLPSLPMTSWLLLPNGVTVEVIVVNIVSAGHVFVQQHTHPTYHALRSLDQQMFLCYSQPGTPALPSPAEIGVICAAPAVEGAWWRAQVISFYKDSNEVEIRYVDYGGYDRVKIDTLRQIRSDFVTLPFQGTEVLLDNIAPLPGEEGFSAEANSALEEMTRGLPLLAQVTNYDNNTGLPLVQMWNMVGEEVVLLNRTLAERGLATWVDSF
ncbi:A kinase (PRKA) anchor protein 1b [Clarias gariepinus]|uniref:A kinase (PRKA) anchor protein 1b n=1 Tax=Clarias gariepinus TaxID=13013 RepID=UPI00234DE362|nr:A kinase (PRKA) anchor protein 1b [Clarias gariepinus]